MSDSSAKKRKLPLQPQAQPQSGNGDANGKNKRKQFKKKRRAEAKRLLDNFNSANVATQAPMLVMEDMRFHDIVFREVFQFSSVDSGFGAARPIHTAKLEMSFPLPIFYSQSLSHLQDRLSFE